MPGGGGTGGGGGGLSYLTINYVSEIGTAPTAKRLSSTTATFTLTSAVLPEMSADGYAFYGWSYNGAILSVGDTITTEATEITVTAVWGRAKKFLDANGLTYFASKLNDYPTNELLGTVIDAIDEAKQDKAYDIIYNISEGGTDTCNKTFNEILTLMNQKTTSGQQLTLIIASGSNYIIPTYLRPIIENNVVSHLIIVGTTGLTTITIYHYADHIYHDITEEIMPSNLSDLNNDLGYALTESPDLTGTPTAPTAAAGTATTQLATTAFVQTAVSNASSGLLKRLIVSTLPTSNIDNNTIYMIAKSTSGINDAYNEFMYINNSWELVGSTETDLSDYYTQNEVNTLLDEKQSINLDIYYHYDEINGVWSCNKTFAQIYTLLGNTLHNKKNINIAFIFGDDTPNPKVYLCTKAAYNSSTSSFEFTFNDRLITHSNTDDIDLTETSDVILPFGQVDSTSTSTVFTATIPGITSLHNGVCVYLTNGVVTSEAGFTLNINNLGAKPVYQSLAAATASTTIFNINYTMLFIYNENRVSGGCWDIFYGFNSNDNTIAYNIRKNTATSILAVQLTRYKIVFTTKDGTLLPSTTVSNSTATSKELTTTAFNPFLPIYYYNSTTTVNAGEKPAVGNTWLQFNTVDLRYSFNSGSTLILNKPVYLRCVPQSDSMIKLDGNDCVTQTLPSSADGKVYLYLGTSYSAYQIVLDMYHPIYKYENEKIILWTGITIPTITIPEIDTTVTQSSENLITSGAVYNAISAANLTLDTEVTSNSNNAVTSSGIYDAIDNVHNEIAELNGVKDNNGFLYSIMNQWISAHLNDAINTEYYQDMYSSLNASAKTMAKAMFDNNAPAALIGRNPTLTTISSDNGITLSLISSNITDTNDGQQWYQMTDIRTINSSLYRVEFNMVLVVESDELVHVYLVMSAHTLGFSVDTTITQNSNNLITSGAVYTSIGNVETLLEDLL